MADDLPARLHRLADSLSGDFVDPGAPREAASELERLYRSVAECADTDVTGSQIRAGRALLGWSRATLAAQAGIAASTLQALEGFKRTIPAPGEGVPTTLSYRADRLGKSLTAVVTALKEAGIVFLADDGQLGVGLRYKG
jgi:hypothetical protein